MKASIDYFRKEISKLRTGRANISIFEDIKVMYYGTPTPINQVATIGVPDPTLITVQPWDPSLMEAVEKAIRASDFGFNPINDGRVIKVPVPPLDEERRQELAKKPIKCWKRKNYSSQYEKRKQRVYRKVGEG